MVDQLKLRRFALLGISAGGWAAIAYAARHQARVSHLLLYGTRCPPADPERGEWMRAVQSLVRVNWGIASKTLADIFAPNADAAMLKYLAVMPRDSATVEMAAGLYIQALGLDLRDLLPKIQAPTLVMHREGDRAIPFAAGRRLAARIANARFVPLAGDDHVSQLGDTEAVLRDQGVPWRCCWRQPKYGRATATGAADRVGNA